MDLWFLISNLHPPTSLEFFSTSIFRQLAMGKKETNKQTQPNQTATVNLDLIFFRFCLIFESTGNKKEIEAKGVLMLKRNENQREERKSRSSQSYGSDIIAA